MGTTADKLQYLNDTKLAIKNALIDNGAQVSDEDTFRSYADKISSIKPKLQDKTVNLTENGTTTVTPDIGYDGLSSVGITADIVSNLSNNTVINSNLAATGTQTWTIPATAKYAIITFVLSHDYSGGSSVNGTPTCTTTKGTLTKKIGTYYENSILRTHTYVWVLTNTTGSASTITLKVDWGGGANYGHRHSFVSAVY